MWQELIVKEQTPITGEIEGMEAGSEGKALNIYKKKEI